MNIFYFRKRFLILLACLIAVLLMGRLFYKEDRGGDPLSQASYFVFGEIQSTVAYLRSELSGLVEKYLFLLSLRDENRRLVKENRKLQTRHKLFEEVMRENQRLKELSNFQKIRSLELLPAQVIGTDFLSQNELLVINKGYRQGLKKFMGVLHPDGLVGWLFRTSPNSSQVISLLNPLSTLPARHQKSRTAGLIVPSKNRPGFLSFDYIDKTVFDDPEEDGTGSMKNWHLGDKIVTLGTDQFPGGFPVGVISDLDFSKKFRPPKVYVQPSVNFYSIEEVMLVLRATSPLDEDED